MIRFETIIQALRSAKTYLYLAIFFLPLERVLVLKLGNSNVRLTHLFLLISILVWLWEKFTEIKAEKKKVSAELKNFSRNFSQISNLYKLVVIYFLILGFSFLRPEAFDRMFSVFIYILFVVGSVFFIPQFFHKAKDLALAVKVFLAGSLAFCVFGLYQFIADMAGAPISWTLLTDKYTKSILGFTRVQGFFVEPLYFANFLIFPIIFCILLLMNKIKSRKLKVFLWLTLALSSVNFILANARGAFIALAIILLILFIANIKKFSKEFYYSAISVLLLIVIAGSLFYFAAPQSPIGNFVYHATHPFEGSAFSERKETFAFAWQMFKEKPLFGYGPGSFGVLAPLKQWEVRENWKIVNNLYLELLAESGIFGFLAMAAFFVYLLFLIFKSWKHTEDKLLKILYEGFFLVILGILIQYNTFSVIYLPYVWITVGLAIACLKMCRQSK
ncbi:MAG: O-antigen ligase family protein [Patescibacteria group bacterium]